MRVLAEIIASDVSLLVTFNHAIAAVIQNNPKPRPIQSAGRNWWLEQTAGCPRLAVSIQQTESIFIFFDQLEKSQRTAIRIAHASILRPRPQQVVFLMA